MLQTLSRNVASVVCTCCNIFMWTLHMFGVAFSSVSYVASVSSVENVAFLECCNIYDSVFHVIHCY